MADGVKFIFKTLIKVPVIIVITYFFFNIIAFCFVYFKMLGASYVVQQTALENNYLPKREYTLMLSYLNDMEKNSMFVENTALIVGNDKFLKDPSKPVANSATVRHQYGHIAVVGVTCNFRPVWPLIWNVQGLEAGSVYGTATDGSLTATYKGINDINREMELAEKYVRANGINKEIAEKAPTAGEYKKNNIKIQYTVPGLKYYPDLK